MSTYLAIALPVEAGCYYYTFLRTLLLYLL